MNTVTERTAVQSLSQLEALCEEHAVSLPQQNEVDLKWSGIGYRLGDLQLVSSLGEVVEVLPLPSLFKVPRTKPWVRGMANIRGNLLPVMDLQAYLNGVNTRLSPSSRVLVVNDNGINAGLIVDDVLGLQHFVMDFKCDEIPGANQEIQQYLMKGFRVGNDYWGIFSMKKLTESTEFLQAAI
ncbi:MAG: chemotaxis protein CheW [Gammaproteobacteria bacterium]